MKLGKTIVADREKAETEDERAQFREKLRRKKIFSIVSYILAVLVVVFLAVTIILLVVKGKKEQKIEIVEAKNVPTVEIIDESGVQYVTERMKEYVGRIEKDVIELGSKVSKVIIPKGKTRELDVYLEGREGYYKCSLDRGTAETAEDMLRMAKYLDTNQKKVKYVDIRIEKRAYYL